MRWFAARETNGMCMKRTILVVDDEAEQRDFMRRVLQLGAYTVLEASDYAEALAVQRGHLGEIDLVVTDVSLPGGNGYQLSRALLAAEPRLQVLFVSGHAGAELCKFFGAQMNDMRFLEKPFRPAEFLLLANSMLDTAVPLTGAATS
jgi:CheY-like chemotaxis protein